jgi:hypothetical protein
MKDPARHEVPKTVTGCHQAGVRTVMITSDHPLKALAIASQIGLAPKESRTEPVGYSFMIEGHQVETMSDGALRRFLTPINPNKAEPIFSRMAPQHKMHVVSVLKDMGEVVAVTGDRVNDAPGLKKTAIGIAMCIAGTEPGKRVRLPLRPSVALSTWLVQQSIAPLGNRDRACRPGVHHLHPLGQRDLWNQPLACLDFWTTRAVNRRGKPQVHREAIQ